MLTKPINEVVEVDGIFVFVYIYVCIFLRSQEENEWRRLKNEEKPKILLYTVNAKRLGNPFKFLQLKK